MKTTLCSFWFLLISLIVVAQAQPNNYAEVRAASKFRVQGEYKKALQIHDKIFKQNPTNSFNNYNMACLYGVMSNKDSCLKYLNLGINRANALFALSDPDLYYLHQFPEWKNITKKIKRLSQRYLQRFTDSSYALQLYSLAAADQAYYSELHTAEMKYGHNSKEVKSIWNKKNKLNKINQKKLETLLKEKGWPKRSAVGLQAAQSAFLIIQHSDLEKMLQYLPVIKKYCDEGEGSCQAYALMFDRIRTYQKKPQRYGTQVRFNKKKKKYELFPLENEGQIHEYRERVGLPPLEHYVSKWNIKLDLKKDPDNFAYADSLINAELSSESKHPYFRGAYFGKNRKEKYKGFGDKDDMIKVDPRNILGNNKDYCLTIPKGSKITVMFVDNQIVDYPDQPDLFLKEHGGANDKALVYVSHDGKTYDSLGITYDGRASSLDLADIGYTKSVKYVRVVALDNNGAFPGYDLEYVKGLPGSSVDAKMNKMEISSYLKKAKEEVDFIQNLSVKKLSTNITKPEPVQINREIIRNRNHFVLEEILFDTKKYTIKNHTLPYLNQLAEELKKINYKKIRIIGHTDNRDTEAANQVLSENRARVIRDYLFSRGVNINSMEYIGKGESQPRMSNDTAFGRAKNRRTEIQIIR